MLLILDDNNRVLLEPIHRYSECHTDYMNASYIDVSIFSTCTYVTINHYYLFLFHNRATLEQKNT